LATALREWLPSVLQVVDPWFSAADVSTGTPWSDELRKAFLEAHIGIVCATPECLQSPWLAFEAGVLFRLQAGAHFHGPVCVYPLDVQSYEIHGPLSQFQWTQSDKEGTYRLLATLNTVGANAHLLPDDVLRRALDAHWPVLEGTLNDIRASLPDETRIAADDVREVPPPPAAFVGRQTELDRLAAYIVGERPATAVCIYGDAETGKTSLAYELAQRYSNLFPTQLYVGAGIDTPEMSQVELLRRIVHRFGLPSGSTLQGSDSGNALRSTKDPPDTERELLVRYLTEMRRRKVLQSPRKLGGLPGAGPC
jgi:hypothetical protein